MLFSLLLLPNGYHAGGAGGVCHRWRRVPPAYATATACEEASPAAVSDEVEMRAARADEMDAVARLQLDVFVPVPEPPALLPLLAGVFEANQRSVRVGMRRRLCDDITTRVAKGSDILVATVPIDRVARLPDEFDASYSESDVRLLGTVDVSVQEMNLPTHSLSDGLYLSHMAVDPAFRRLGLGRRLLAAAEEAARSRCADGIYLHVERSNEAAMALYEGCGYVRQPETAPFLSFTRALNVQHRDVLLYRKVIAHGDA